MRFRVARVAQRHRRDRPLGRAVVRADRRGGLRPDDASAAFFPGYPLPIRAVDLITLWGRPAALLVSNASFLGALIVLFALTTREWSTTSLDAPSCCSACFPSSFFFLAPYSESPYLLSVSSRSGGCADRWGRGDGRGGRGDHAQPRRAAGARILGGSVALKDRSRAVALAGASAGAAGVCGLLVRRDGDAMRPLHAQEAWLRTFQVSPITLADAIVGAPGHRRPAGHLLDRRSAAHRDPRHPPPGLVAAHPHVVPRLRRCDDPRVLSYPLPERPLLSAPRLLLVVFPLLLGDGGAVPRAPVRRGQRRSCSASLRSRWRS